MKGGRVHTVLFEAAVVAQAVAVIGHVNDERVVGLLGGAKMVEDAAEVAIEVEGAGVVGGDDALFLRGCEVAEDVGNLPSVFGADGRHGKALGSEEGLVVFREPERRVRFLEAEPEGEGLVGLREVFGEPRFSLVSGPGAAHLLEGEGLGEFFGVQPLFGGGAEGLPGAGRFADVFLPAAVDAVFGHGGGEAVHAILAGPIEVHFAEDSGAIAGVGEQVGESASFFGERSLERCDAGGVGIESREEGLARRSADGGVAVVGGEAGAFGGEAVEIRGAGELVAGGAEDVTGVIIGDEKEEIGFAGSGHGESI